MQGVAELLSENGRFFCVLPADNSGDIVAYALKSGLSLFRQLLVKARPEGKVIRHLLEFGRYPKQEGMKTQTETLNIYQDAKMFNNANKHYSQAYIELCKDYYLKF